MTATERNELVGDEGRFQCLALTGGGYRGLFTASALAAIEASTGTPIARNFEILAGASIGGIIALAAAFERPMSDVVNVFKEHGPKIFPPDDRAPADAGLVDYWAYRKKPRYRRDPLVAAVEALIPRGTLLGQALHPVLIPAVNLTAGAPQVFKTRHHRDFIRDWKFPVTDIALATSAAPTYFPLAVVDGQLYADGGLFANAPELICVHEAEHFFSRGIKGIHVLSVGTTTQKYSISYSAGTDFGLQKWMAGGRLFSVTISAQQQFVEQLMLHRFSARYLKLDAAPSDEQARDLGLDVATPVATATLEALGRKSATDLLGNRLDPYLAHRAKDLIVERL